MPLNRLPFFHIQSFNLGTQAVKQSLRRLFAPILNRFESGTEAFSYEASHRTILIVMGCLFSGLAAYLVNYINTDTLGYLLPVFVFGGVGLISLLVGLLGNDRAVAKIWGSRK